MSQAFSTEIRQAGGKNYLKVFIDNPSYLNVTRTRLSKLSSVSKVNVTLGKEHKSLTVYPSFLSRVSSLKADVDKNLQSFFKRISQRNTSIYNMSELDNILSKFPDVKNLIETAANHSKNESEYRYCLDDLRLGMELLLKHILKNEKSLENQKELGSYLQEKGLSTEARNMLITQYMAFCRYQDNHVKHIKSGEFANAIDVPFIFDMSLLFIKNLIIISKF